MQEQVLDGNDIDAVTVCCIFRNCWYMLSKESLELVRLDATCVTQLVAQDLHALQVLGVSYLQLEVAALHFCSKVDGLY